MNTLKTPFRYDFVGSFLRPEKLKAAKKAFEEGTITKEELDRITDECVTEIVAKQKAAGFHAITDGEFRRKFWRARVAGTGTSCSTSPPMGIGT